MIRRISFAGMVLIMLASWPEAVAKANPPIPSWGSYLFGAVVALLVLLVFLPQGRD